MPQSTDNFTDEQRGIFAMFKGETGSGKSVAALSFPGAYVLDHDNKMPAIARKHFPNKTIHWDNFTDVFQVGAKLTEFVEEGCPYETIIGDSVTSLSYTALKTVDDVKGTNILDMLRNVKGTKTGGKQIELRGYDYYNGEDSFLKFYLDLLKLLWARPGNPKNVIIIVHVLHSEQPRIGSDIVTVTRKIVTAGQKIAAYIPSQFDEVWLFGNKPADLGSDKVLHIMTTEAIGEDSAKTAYRMPAKIDFTDSSLYDKIKRYIVPVETVDLGGPKLIV